MEYHDDFGLRLSSFMIDQLRLLFVPQQARQYSMYIESGMFTESLQTWISYTVVALLEGT